jgi:hypothetical protein
MGLRPTHRDESGLLGFIDSEQVTRDFRRSVMTVNSSCGPDTISFMSDFDEARKRAESGSVVSQSYVGWCYLYGRETDP